jgi:methylmalonyl-CoA/ethylmalonyl-CoA epimerase
MVIDHIGIVVEHIKDGIDQWTRLFGYSQSTEAVVNTRQRVRVVFMAKKDSCMIKLVEPLDEKSPVHQFARKGGGLHHICFRCDNVNGTVERFKRMGLRVLSEPEPGEAFDGHPIAFVYVQPGLNIELIDTAKKAKQIDLKKERDQER